MHFSKSVPHCCLTLTKLEHANRLCQISNFVRVEICPALLEVKVLHVHREMTGMVKEVPSFSGQRCRLDLLVSTDV